MSLALTLMQLAWQEHCWLHLSSIAWGHGLAGVVWRVWSCASHWLEHQYWNQLTSLLLDSQWYHNPLSNLNIIFLFFLMLTFLFSSWSFSPCSSWSSYSSCCSSCSLELVSVMVVRISHTRVSLSSVVSETWTCTVTAMGFYAVNLVGPGYRLGVRHSEPGGSRVQAWC